MTTDRLAALIRQEAPGLVGAHGKDYPDWLAARLAAQGVTVGLDVERLAAAMRAADLWIER